LSPVVNNKGLTSSAFSINGNQIVLIGQPGTATPPIALSSKGLPEFNPEPSAGNMTDVMKDINGATLPTSGYLAETWSSGLFDSLASHDLLYNSLENTTVTATFPDEGLADQLKMVTRLIQTRNARGSNVDLFYVQLGGFYTR